MRARLCVPPGDEAVLRALGAHLGSLAGRDLAARCGKGRLDAKGKAVSRAVRLQALKARLGRVQRQLDTDAGTRQATRQPSTVRGRRLDKAMSR